jgi:geranylgeranyl diphosphate synthase type II
MIDLIASSGQTPAQEAALYHLNTGGSRMRARLALASGAIHLDPTDCTAAAAACELLHNASLVHDDISDGDLLRRSALTVRSAYGTGVALCTGDLLLSAAFMAASQIKDSMTSLYLTRMMAQTAARVIGGQSIELADQTQPTTPTRRQYLTATRAKTAPLIELPIRIGMLKSTTHQASAQSVEALAAAIGLAYQILDDLDDLQAAASTQSAPSVHRLHAWWHHQIPCRETDTVATTQRCLRHVRAALRRASTLATQLPTPLRGCVEELIEKLTVKAAQ